MEQLNAGAVMRELRDIERVLHEIEHHTLLGDTLARAVVRRVKQSEDLLRRLTCHTPWEQVHGEERCYFCGAWRNFKASHTDHNTHMADCAYVEARNQVGADDE